MCIVIANLTDTVIIKRCNHRVWPKRVCISMYILSWSSWTTSLFVHIRILYRVCIGNVLSILLKFLTKLNLLRIESLLYGCLVKSLLLLLHRHLLLSHLLWIVISDSWCYFLCINLLRFIIITYFCRVCNKIKWRILNEKVIYVIIVNDICNVWLYLLHLCRSVHISLICSNLSRHLMYFSLFFQIFTHHFSIKLMWRGNLGLLLHIHRVSLILLLRLIKWLLLILN